MKGGVNAGEVGVRRKDTMHFDTFSDADANGNRFPIPCISYSRLKQHHYVLLFLVPSGVKSIRVDTIAIGNSFFVSMTVHLFQFHQNYICSLKVYVNNYFKQKIFFI